MGLNMKEKQAVTREYKGRYQKASKKEKKALLDHGNQFSKIDGYDKIKDGKGSIKDTGVFFKR